MSFCGHFWALTSKMGEDGHARMHKDLNGVEESEETEAPKEGYRALCLGRARDTMPINNG